MRGKTFPIHYTPALPRERSRPLIALIKTVSQLPIIFGDGSEAAVEKTKTKIPDACYTSSEDLEFVLGENVD